MTDVLRRFGSSVASLLTIAAVATGCAIHPRHDPLEGWKGGQTAREGPLPDVTITTDYQDYIRNLPAREGSTVNDFSIRFYEGPDGQRAVEITIPIDGVRWKHVLLYDKSGKRTRVIKYASSRYLS